MQGFGQLNIDDIVSATPARQYVNETYAFTSAGQKKSWTFPVDDPNKPVKIALAWSDAASPAFVDQNGPVATFLLNDLDLLIDTGDGGTCQQYYGNNFAVYDTNPDLDANRGEESIPYACDQGHVDTKNPAEKVVFFPNLSPSAIRASPPASSSRQLTFRSFAMAHSTKTHPARKPTSYPPSVWYACALVLCFPAVAFANLGDVLQATPQPLLIGPPVPGDIFLVRQGQPYQSIIHFANVGSLGVGLDPANNIYVPRDVDIAVYDQASTFQRTIAPGIAFTSPGRVVFDAGGNIYAAGGYKLYKLDSDGNLLVTFALTGATGIDLAADQCTMYFTIGTTLGRYNVCQNLQLADITTLSSNAYDLRILPDGSLLVALGSSVAHISPSGALLRSYAVIAHAIALAPGGMSFWVGPGLSQVDVQSGTVLATLLAPSPTTGLAVVGEPRAALNPSAIPTLSPFALLVLTITLVAVGLRLLHRT